MTETRPAAAATRTVAGAELPAPGRWQIDPGHTEVAFIGRHFMLTKVRGRFTGVTGVIVVAENPGESTAEITIAMASLDSGSQARDDHLRSADFFDAARHPTATFTGRAIDWQGTRGLLAGDLTIRGVTRPVHLAGRIPRPRHRPMGRPAGHLHRRGHPQPRGLGPDLEHVPRRRRTAGLQRDPHRNRSGSSAPANGAAGLTIPPPRRAPPNRRPGTRLGVQTPIDPGRRRRPSREHHHEDRSSGYRHSRAVRGTKMLMPLWLRLMGGLSTPMFNFKVVR
jgi:polyisoprenoid-binding protein YceI